MGGQEPSDTAPGGFAQPPQMQMPQQQYTNYGYPYPAAFPVAQPPAPRSGLALTGMILGIVGLCTSIFYIGGVIGIVGLVFSIIGIRAVNRTGQSGKGMAIAGLVTSIIAIIVNAIEIVLIVWVLHTANNCAQYENTSTTTYQQCIRNGLTGN
jgi:amino acid transporter